MTTEICLTVVCLALVWLASRSSERSARRDFIRALERSYEKLNLRPEEQGSLAQLHASERVREAGMDTQLNVKVTPKPRAPKEKFDPNKHDTVMQ